MKIYRLPVRSGSGLAADLLRNALPDDLNAAGDQSRTGDFLDLTRRAAAVVDQNLLTEPHRPDILLARKRLCHDRWCHSRCQDACKDECAVHLFALNLQSIRADIDLNALRLFLGLIEIVTEHADGDD